MLVVNKVIKLNEIKQTKVPKMPNSMMLLMFMKNLFLYMLKPEVNTIGGSTK